MKVKSLIIGAATAVIVPVASLAGPVLASSPGQIDGGDIYRVKNLTKNSDYAATASAGACEEVQYKVLLHNSGFGSVDNVVAKATLPSSGGTSTMTVTYDSNGPSNSVSASATLNLASGQTVSYESGSSQLLDNNNNVVKSLSDGITNGGVNTGTLNGSTSEFVTFKAKTSCPTPPPVKPPTPPATPPATPAAPTALVNTGPGSDAAIFAIVTVAGAFGYRLYLSRRLSRQ